MELRRLKYMSVLAEELHFGKRHPSRDISDADCCALLAFAAASWAKECVAQKHGSAPDIAGRGLANPIGSILSVAMMLRFSLGSPSQDSSGPLHAATGCDR